MTTPYAPAELAAGRAAYDHWRDTLAARRDPTYHHLSAAIGREVAAPEPPAPPPWDQALAPTREMFILAAAGALKVFREALDRCRRERGTENVGGFFAEYLAAALAGPPVKDPRLPLQAWADENLDPAYRQPLKTVEQACAAVGWEFKDRPTCCGAEAKLSAFLGAPYHVECPTCGKFIHDVTGPVFSPTGSSVNFLDGKKVAVDVDARWLAGTKERP